MDKYCGFNGTLRDFERKKWNVTVGMEYPPRFWRDLIEEGEDE